MCSTDRGHHRLQSSNRGPASQQRLRCAALLQRLVISAREWKTSLLIRWIMPVCTCTCVYEWVNILPTDLPSGGKGCFQTRELHNPVLNECGGEDRHSRTMKPSCTPCWSYTHLKSSYPQCKHLACIPTGTSVVPCLNNTAPLPEATSVNYGSHTTLLGPY